MNEVFRPRTVLAMILTAAIAFGAFLLLIAFGPTISGGRDGRGHALSVSGNGYAGLVRLAQLTGTYPVIVRDEAELKTRALLIVTPEPLSDPKALVKLLAGRHGAPTLIVLPKWLTRPLPGHPGWSQKLGMASETSSALSMIAPKLSTDQTPYTSTSLGLAGVPRLARSQVGPQKEQQRLAGGDFVPLLLDRDGRVVIGQLIGRPVYVLADPDLLDNAGLADPWTARQGWRIVDDLSPSNELGFDLTLNGFAVGRNPLRLVLEPPFLPVTLCVVAAALLAGLHGATRFGAPIPPAPPIPPGKRTLVDNTAMLFRVARKEHRTGAAYAQLTRDAVAQAAGAPPWLSGDDLNEMLDRADADGEHFATLAWHAEVAEDRNQLLGAARALYRWRRNRIR